MSTTKIKFSVSTSKETRYDIKTGEPKAIERSYLIDQDGMAISCTSNEIMSSFYENNLRMFKIMAMAPDMLEAIEGHCNWLISKRDELSGQDEKLREQINNQISYLNEIYIKYYSHLKKA